MAFRRKDGGSIARQVALIVLGSLFLAHALSAVVWLRFAPPPPSIQVLAARIELTARMVGALSPADRAAVVATASRTGHAVTLADAPPSRITGEPWEHASLLHEALVHTAGTSPPVVRTAAPAPQAGLPAIAAVAIPDGQWLIFDIPQRGPLAESVIWLGPFVDVMFGALPLALLSIWAARRVTGPLVRLAAAAEHVGTIDDPLPLPEEGTREIRKVARALNGLLEKLRRFVWDRTRMLAAISHDLRTPLTRLRLRAESVADPAVRDKMLQDILRMDAMISSTLAFIREDGLQEAVEPVDIAALLMTICDAFADSGADVSYDGPLHVAGACRPQAMERALTNLVENAVKFGGSATVTLRLAASGPVIDVEDAGPGIAAAQRDEVFKPFTRGDTARGMEQGGVGLGLSIARSIVQGHGGTIELHDRVPQGLLVRVRLPRATTARPRPVAARMLQPAP
jgi:signal transduction histidine kinase